MGFSRQRIFLGNPLPLNPVVIYYIAISWNRTR